MSRKTQIALAVVGGLALLGGVALALTLGSHSLAIFVGGWVAAGAGLLLLVVVPAGRNRASLAATSLGLVAVVGALAIARNNGSGGGAQPSPSNGAPVPEENDSQANLKEGLRLAQESLETLQGIKDYTATFHKREWAKGTTGAFHLTNETMAMKFRQEPFAVYMRFDLPTSKRGTETIYPVDDGMMIAHSTEFPANLLGTFKMAPDDWRAMIDNRHTIHKVGLRNMLLEIKRLAKEHEERLKECEITFVEEEEIDGRPCKCLQIRNPEPKEGFPFAHARIWLDEGYNVPVAYEAWDFVEGDPNAKTRLIEKYVYTDLKFNADLTDEDFDPENEQYDFYD